MPASQISKAVQQLHKTMLVQEATDGQLLECFISSHEAAALEVLVRRHGPMVWGVCRRILGNNHHDVEDAFQATFLVLVRKAASVAPKEMVGNWLYGVAYQTALKARASILKRQIRETRMTRFCEPAAAPPKDSLDEWQPLLDQELNRLSEKYRVPIVLCDLQGKTRKAAAEHLGVPEGTLSTRLARGRSMLAKRLTRRGVTLTAGALATALTQHATAASVPASLIAATVKTGSAAVIAAPIALLAEGVLKTMLIAKLKTIAALIIALTCFFGAGLLLRAKLTAGTPDAPEPTVQPPRQSKKAEAKKDTDEDSMQLVREINLAGYQSKQPETDFGRPMPIADPQALAKAFPDQAWQQKIAAQVNFDKERLLLFTWSGADDDKLTTKLATSSGYADRWFKRLDVNADGKLSAEEFRTQVPNADEFAKWDKNGDGVLDLDEYRAYYAIRLARQCYFGPKDFVNINNTVVRFYNVPGTNKSEKSHVHLYAIRRDTTWQAASGDEPNKAKEKEKPKKVEKAAIKGAILNDLGEPVKDVRVYIRAAGPRVGAGDLCCYNYPGCGTTVATDAEGRFLLDDLDPTLVFQLLVAAKGHVAVLCDAVDPRDGQLKVALRRHELDKRDPATIVRGRVVDEQGKPVPNALVKPHASILADGGGYGGVGEDSGIDLLAITDERGEFRIGVTDKVAALYTTVRAPRLAPMQTGKLPTGGKVNEIKLVAGATVTGKVVKDGKPLSGVTLCMTQNVVEDLDRKRDRLALFGMTLQIDTDANGNFRFENVPPDEDFVLFGVMNSFRTHGALKNRPVVVKENGSKLDVGTLNVDRGYKLSGRIVLADGKPMPAGKKVFLTRREECSYDVQITTTAADGGFSFVGLPNELVQLETNKIQGYRVSSKNYSYDAYFGYGLWGMADRDINDLCFLLEPGEFANQQVPDGAVDTHWKRRAERIQGAPAEFLKKAAP
jgi:RNA polymerase sigma factor (sigma-70 family)